MPVPGALSTDLSTDQLLLTTLLVKLAVMAASATILVRFRRFRHFLIFEHRPSPDRLAFEAFEEGDGRARYCTRRKCTVSLPDARKY